MEKYKQHRHLPAAAVWLTAVILGLVLGSLSWAHYHKNTKVAEINRLTAKLVETSDASQKAQSPTRKVRLHSQAMDTAKKRSALVLNLVRTDPDSAEAAAISPQDRQSLPADIQKVTEEVGNFKGQLKVSHADDFAKDKDTEAYSYQTANSRFYMHFAKTPANIQARAETGFNLRAVVLGTDMGVPSSSTSTIELAQPTAVISSVPMHKKIAVILFNFQADQSQPFTTAQVMQNVFSSNTSVANYYKASTYGQILLEGKLQNTGDVFGWYTINDDPTLPCGTGASPWPPDQWAMDAQAQATAAGVDLSGYDNFVYIFPARSCGGWAGASYIYGNQVWLNGNMQPSNIAHELGHNYGLDHASRLFCTDNNGQPVFFSTTCTKIEYGDPYDPMSSTRYNHFGIFNKARLLSLAPSNIKRATVSGTYQISTLEPPSQSAQMLQVPIQQNFGNGIGNNYYLEYRQAYDQFDTQNIDGIIIRRAYDLSSLSHTYLLDASPVLVSSTFDPDVGLVLNQTVTDSIAGISFKLIALTPTTATIQVTVPADTEAPTTPTNLQIQPNY